VSNVDISGQFQHGFKKNRSTVTALMEIVQSIARAMDENKVVAVAAIDLSAAFDIVDRNLLLAMMRARGFTSSLLALLEEWIVDRSTYVSVGDVVSDKRSLKSGVIQGSILGPVLFSIMLNGLSKFENLVAYADDITTWAVGESEEAAAQELEYKLDHVFRHLKAIGMVCNTEKTEVVFFHRVRKIIKDIKVDEAMIRSKEYMKLLGITLDSHLSWAKQTEEAISSASRALGGVKIISKYFSSGERSRLLKTYVFSKLYYAQEIWLHPSLAKSVIKRLTQFSGRALAVVCSEEASFIKRHQMTGFQLPIERAWYVTSVCCFKLYNDSLNELEWENLKRNRIKSSRNTRFQSIRSNNYKVGMNLLSNRAWHVRDLIMADWFNLPLHVFKKRVMSALQSFKIP
jgi:ribonuclease P/MRP protein subunit RPP40